MVNKKNDSFVPVDQTVVKRNDFTSEQKRQTSILLPLVVVAIAVLIICGIGIYFAAAASSIEQEKDLYVFHQSRADNFTSCVTGCRYGLDVCAISQMASYVPEKGQQMYFTCANSCIVKSGGEKVLNETASYLENRKVFP